MWSKPNQWPISCVKVRPKLYGPALLFSGGLPTELGITTTPSVDAPEEELGRPGRPLPPGNCA